MKPSTREWIKKAESDWQAALTLSRKRKPPFHDEVCFHCQQSAEKYLKARLEENGTRFPKTHDLEKVLNLCLAVEPLWAALMPAALRLTRYGVEFRYPGGDANKAHAKVALKDAQTVRREARIAFGLKP